MNNQEEYKESKYLKVDINSLKMASDELNKHNIVISDNLANLNKEFNNIDEYFNTNTGIEYKELVSNYIKTTSEYINSKNNYLVDKLNNINDIYWQLYGEIKDDITGSDNNG